MHASRDIKVAHLDSPVLLLLLIKVVCALGLKILLYTVLFLHPRHIQITKELYNSWVSETPANM